MILPKTVLTNPWLQWPLRVILGVLFIYAGVQKTADPHQSADNIAAFKLLPKILISPVALGLPVFEILVGLFLIVGPCRRATALAILGMCGIFLIALVAALLRGLDIDCGCFGGGEAKGPTAIVIAILRDLVLTVMALMVWRGETSSDPGTENLKLNTENS